MPTGKWPNGSVPSKQSLADHLSGIDGWTYLDELWALHETVRNFPGRDTLSVVEVGSWKGRSTVALALGVSTRGEGRVYAVDPHTGSREHIEAYGSVDTFGDFLQNIKLAGVAPVVEAIRSTSLEASRRFEPRSVHVLFIDGSHEYGDVLVDIERWTPTLADRAIVAFNDPLCPGVYRALLEVVLKSPSPYRRGRYVANTLFFVFQEHSRWRLGDSASLLWLRLLLALRLLLQGPATYAPAWAIGFGRRLYEKLLP